RSQDGSRLKAGMTPCFLTSVGGTAPLRRHHLIPVANLRIIKAARRRCGAEVVKHRLGHVEMVIRPARWLEPDLQHSGLRIILRALNRRGVEPDHLRSASRSAAWARCRTHPTLYESAPP